MIARYIAILFAVLATSLHAQTFPTAEHLTINDYADLLSPDVEVELDFRLKELSSETGVEMTVLTLDRLSDWSEALEMEPYATALFNHWGIGDALRNDGVLVLVLHEDRQMRIELGAAYGRDWDNIASSIVQEWFLPHFRNDDYETGITTGSEEIIGQIVTPFLAGEAAPQGSGRLIAGLILGVIFAIPAAVVYFLIRARRKERICPSCKKPTLKTERTTEEAATLTTAGRGITHRTCASCDFVDQFGFTIAATASRSSSSSSSGGSFGGGSSGGGGASGSW